MIGLDGFRFHHFGLAAADPDRAVGAAALLGYVCGPSIHDPLQRVNLRWCEHASSPPLEIVSPVGAQGPLATILAEHPTSFYHLCYETGFDTDAALHELRSAGARVVTVVPPLPAVLFNGRRVSFHTVRGFGLIELLEGAPAVGAGAA